MQDDYRYVLELFRTSGEPLGQVALTPDWEPAVECARYGGLRSLGVWATQSGAERRVEPVWDEKLGEPYVGAFRVHLAAPGAHEWFWLHHRCVPSVRFALIEAGVPCGDDVALAEPLDALRVFSRDVACRATAGMASGPPLTAIHQIQRQYLDHARRHLDQPFMPAWARKVCDEWLAMLDRLEGAPGAVARSLDWAIKLTLYQDRARRRGVDWEALPAWTHVVATLDGARQKCAPSADRLSAALVLAEDGPVRAKVGELAPYLEDQGLQWSGLDAFLTLRQKLCEVDTRFGQIGAQSLFRRLEALGTLEHVMPGVDAIDYAVEHPPAEGRAHVRGEVIRRAAPDGSRLRCSWSAVVDTDNGTRLDLSDPFTEQEAWIVAQAEPAVPDPPVTPSAPTAGVDEDCWLWGDLAELCSRRLRRRSRE